jgi:signal transduction histidine kinase
VAIEQVLLDRKPLPPHQSVQIKPGSDDLEIHYTALSFSRPEQVKFKYKLVGLDNDWVDAGTRRTVYYSHLPPGNYTFTVIADNGEGVWNNEGVAISIIVTPPFWRTWWFSALLLLIAVGIAYLFFRWRITQLQQRHRAQEVFSKKLMDAQESERKRLAVELHDSLGQSLVIIKNRALMSLSKPEDHTRAMAQMDEISEAASHAIAEVKEIASNLHPYQLDRLGLAAALKTMLETVSNSSDIQITREIDQIDGELSKEAEINLYRIIQESLNNIVKHSAATQTKVSIKKDSRSIHLLIHDNGKGFDAERLAAEPTGLGLTGIRERAKLLGAKPEIRSAPGKGTTISVEINLQE